MKKLWMLTFLVAAFALVAPLASHASEFPGMGAAYAQRLERDRAISSLWLAPQALIGNDATSKGDATFLSREENSLHAAGMPRLLCSPSPFTFTSPPNTITPWSVRGAYEDWVHIDLPESFRFPVGLEYVDRITVMAWGEVWCPSKGDATFLSRVTGAEDSSFSRGRNAASPLAALPQRVSIEPNGSMVSHGLTASNTYLVAWHNACVERSATNRVNAAIELFPDGSIVTNWQPLDPNQPPTTNHQQPVPPLGFHGHGQDADWIHGNFELLRSFDPALTNAEEIISLGYDDWLTTRAVGIDQENGIYKATVTINQQLATNSQQPIYLVCGPYKVAVSGVGTYSFPLEVFEHYPTRTYPEALPLDIVYDDGLIVPDESAASYAAAPRRRSLSSPSDNIYDVCMHPTLYLWPRRIALSVAPGTIIRFKVNVPSLSECIVQSTLRAARVALRGSRMAEIEEAEAADIFTILIRHDNESIEASGEIYDDRPPHYCDDTCICPDCYWCSSSTNRYTEASVTNSCPCCACL